MISLLRNKLLSPKSFETLTQQIAKISYPNPKLYDSIQVNKYGYTTHSWFGYKCCGESCYIIQKELIKQGYDAKVYLNYRKYEDHCFIMIDNNIIIDPTPKQFLDDHRMEVNCAYRTYLFNLPPFFIGTKEMLNDYLLDVIEENKNVYGITFFEINSLLKYWDIQKEIKLTPSSTITFI